MNVRTRSALRPLALRGVAGVLALVVFAAGAVALPSSRAATAPAACTPQSNEGVFLFATGEKLISSVDVPVCLTGQVKVSFAGDRAGECAARGLCEYSGIETWNPQGPADLLITTFARRGRRSTDVTLLLGESGAPVSATVTRATRTGSDGVCRDRTSGEFGFFRTQLVARGRAELSVSSNDSSVFGTRCAGPVDTDLARALPEQTVSLARLRHGRFTVDLAGSTAFAAVGFSGTVDSTVTLTLGRPHRSPANVTPPPGTPPVRVITARYKVTQVSGETVATVRSTPNATACRRLDACGLRGSISVTSVTGRTSLAPVFLSASASASRRRSRRDLLTALGIDTGGNTSGVSLGGGGELTGGSVREAVSQDGGRCEDHLALDESALLFERQAGRLLITFAPSLSAAADPLRTRCPGPALGEHPLASASLPLDVLRWRAFVVRLHGDAFRDGPYRVTMRSTLSIRLVRGRVTAQLLPEDAGVAFRGRPAGHPRY